MALCGIEAEAARPPGQAAALSGRRGLRRLTARGWRARRREARRSAATPGPAPPGPVPLGSATPGPVPLAELRWRDGARAPFGDFAPWAIPNDALRRELVPARHAPWDVVSAFSLSYDGHAYWDGLPALARRVVQRWTRDGSLPGTVDELRACLFYEQRRWHHYDEDPSGRAAQYVRALLDALRELVPATRRLGPLVIPDPRVKVAPEAHVRLVPAPRPVPAAARSRPTTVRPLPAREAHVQPVPSNQDGGGGRVLVVAGGDDEGDGAGARDAAVRARHPSAYRAPATVPGRAGGLRPAPTAVALDGRASAVRRPRPPWRRGTGAPALAPVTPMRRPTGGNVHGVSGTVRALVPGVAGPSAARAAVEFHGDDAGYLAWRSHNPAGFVLNVATPRAERAVLHGASCPAVGPGTTDRSPTTRPTKVCGDLQALEAWSAARATAVSCCRRCLG